MRQPLEGVSMLPLLPLLLLLLLLLRRHPAGVRRQCRRAARRPGRGRGARVLQMRAAQSRGV